MVWDVEVKKRLGKIEKFDREKVAFSIFKAAQRVGGKDKKLANTLSKEVEDYLKENFSDRKIITTNEIGEAVEKILIERGHAKTAKTFILYREGQRRARKKLIKFKDLANLHQFLKLTDGKIVFTSGVYDVFHVGHARYLKKASLQGDVLVVGLNSDGSARRLKGKERPILGEETRAEMLSFLEFVNFVVIFPQLTAHKIISELKPDIYICVEGSWRDDFEQKPEVKEVRKYGGKVIVLPHQSSEFSTTTIINKIIDGRVNSSNGIRLVAAGFLVEDGKILLVKQKNHQIWTPPGGLADPKGDPELACIREVKEEVGLDVKVYGVFRPTLLEQKTFNGRILILNYLVRRDMEQDININSKMNKEDEGGVEKYKWVRFEDLKKFKLGPNVVPVVKELTRSSDFWEKAGIRSKIRISKSKKDWDFMKRALKEAKKSTCWFRKVGSVLVKSKTVLLLGYNKIMPDENFCKKMGCVREKLGVLPGEKLELCTVLHAEMNIISLAAKNGISLNGTTIYLTCFPCQICAKIIANSGIERLVFLGDYSNLEGLLYLKKAKIKVVKLEKG